MRCDGVTREPPAVLCRSPRRRGRSPASLRCSHFLRPRPGQVNAGAANIATAAGSWGMCAGRVAARAPCSTCCATPFMGGENENPTEEDNGGHAQVVEVVFGSRAALVLGLLEVFS